VVVYECARSVRLCGWLEKYAGFAQGQEEEVHIEEREHEKRVTGLQV
jgi:hypothetical protein